MLLRVLAALSVGVCAAATGFAGETTWQRNADWLKEQIGQCAGDANPDACRYFPARALDRLFGIEQMCQAASCANPWEVAEVVLEGGAHVVLFEDVMTGEWYLQKP